MRVSSVPVGGLEAVRVVEGAGETGGGRAGARTLARVGTAGSAGTGRSVGDLCRVGARGPRQARQNQRILDEGDAVERLQVDDQPLGSGEFQRVGLIRRTDETFADAREKVAETGEGAGGLGDRPREVSPGDLPVAGGAGGGPLESTALSRLGRIGPVAFPQAVVGRIADERQQQACHNRPPHRTGLHRTAREADAG